MAEALAHRIVSGTYAEGDVLPSCRDVALDLNVAKSTANDAYEILERKGIVKSVPGKGVFVTGHPEAGLSDDDVQQSLISDIWLAKAVGIERDTLWKMIGDAVWKAYGVTEIAMAFIGFDQRGASWHAREIAEHLSLPVTPVLLEDFVSDAQYFLSSFDILVTSFYLLARVTSLAGEHKGSIVGADFPPVSEDLLRIAKSKKGSRVGIVYSKKPHIDPLMNLIRSYNPDVEFFSCFEKDVERLTGIASQVDWLIVTEAAHEIVLECCPDVPTITVAFRIEAQSLQFLKDNVRKVVRHKHGLHYSLEGISSRIQVATQTTDNANSDVKDNQLQPTRAGSGE